MKLLFTTLALLCAIEASSQNIDFCATHLGPSMAARQSAIEAKIYAHFSKLQTAGNQHTESGLQLLTLPVVFHIIHNNGPENIPDNQVVNGLKQLNEAFANLSYYDQGTGANTMIQFCLAQRTPDNLATTGITRDQSSLTEMNLDMDDINLKNIIRWNPTDYINIWLVREICSTASCAVVGYAYFPSSHGQPEDGIVIEAKYLGLAPGNTGVLAHEMGHYLGLYHTFQDGCQNDDCLLNGDRVCDTPPDQSTDWVPCNTPVNSCTTDVNSGFSTDQNDMILNFMDYTDFNCFNDFTSGQGDRMHWHIENVRQSLLQSPACLTPCPNPITALFSASVPSTTIDVGTTVNFTNLSQQATGYLWSINGIQFSTAQNPNYTFSSEGVFILTLTASGTDPLLCPSQSFSMTFQVICPVKVSFTASPLQINPGGTVNFTNTSQNAGTFEWFLDGVSQGPAFPSYVFPVSGAYAVKLTAGNGACEKSVVLYISVQDSCQKTSFQELVGQPNVVNIGHGGFPTADGGYMIGGRTKSPSGDDDAMLIKLDATGNVVWSKRFGGSGNDDLWEISPAASNGEFWACIRNDIGGVNQNDEVLARFSAGGNLIWSKNISTPKTENIYRVNPTSDGGWIAVGAFGNATSWSTLFIKFDATGNIQWQKAWDAAATDYATNAEEIPGGGYIACGFGQSLGPGGGQDAFLLRLDANGNQIWARGYGSPFGSSGFSTVFADSDGGFTAIGSTNGFGGTNESWIMKTNALGEVLWTKVYHVSDNTYCSSRYVIRGNDGGFVIACSDESSNPKARMMKISDDGALEWAHRYTTGLSSGTLWSVRSMPGGKGYMFVGAASPNGSNAQALILVTDNAGFIGACTPGPDLVTVEDVTPTLGSGTSFFAETPPDLLNISLVTAGINTTKNILCQGKCLDTPEICNNGIDDDGNGLFDCLDPACDCASCSGGQARVWYMGRNAGLDFSTDPPAPLDNGQTTTGEGCTVASDPNGHLLFYADPKNIYNRNHAVMPNGSGIFGHPSSTQQIVVPHPGNKTKFYVFTPDSYDNGPTYGLTYSLVDMSLAGGLGDVVTTEKNVTLVPASELVEQITAVRACNGKDYWVVSHRKNSNAFLVWKIDAAGLHANTPSVQNIGSSAAAPNGFFDVIGQLKFSSDGRRLARAQFHSHGVEWYDFDAATGLISNPKAALQQDAGNVYGLEFSPDGRILYYSSLNAPSQLVQVDLEANNPSASSTVLSTYPGDYRYGQIQSAPNGKIYLTNSGPFQYTQYLGVIHHPNVSGMACAYQENGQFLGSLSQGVNLGLPGFPTNYFYKPTIRLSPVNPDTVCAFPANLTLHTIVSCSVDSLTWSVVGPGQVLAHAADSAIVHLMQPGAAAIIVKAFSACGMAADTMTVFVQPAPPVLNLGPDITVCTNGVHTFHAGSGFKTYRWQDGNPDSTYTTLFPGKYWLDVWDDCGHKQTDTITVKFNPVTAIQLPDSVVVCHGSTWSFHLPAGFVHWQWIPGVGLNCDTCATVTATVVSTQTYIVVARTPEGCLSSDTLTIIKGNIIFHSQKDSLICAGHTIQINGMTLAPGDSIVQMLTSLGGCDSLAVLRVVGVDTVFSSLDTLICLSSTILIHGVTLPPDTTAIFYLKTQMGCDSVLTVNTLALDTAVHYLTLAVCPGDSALYNGGHYPAGNDYTFHFSGGNGCDSTVFVHVLAFPGVSVNLPPIDSIALGDTIMLQPAVTGTPPYLWMWSPATGLSCTDCANPIATPQQNGIYLVKVTDANGCTAMDSIAIAVNRDCAVYIPNAFTPNSDNLNDWFTIFSFPNACIREITVLRIFDRWGELVFERRHFASNVGNLGWDGRYRGQDMPSDVLVWYAEWQLEDGSVKRKSGDVTLLR